MGLTPGPCVFDRNASVHMGAGLQRDSDWELEPKVNQDNLSRRTRFWEESFQAHLHTQLLIGVKLPLEVPISWNTWHSKSFYFLSFFLVFMHFLFKQDAGIRHMTYVSYKSCVLFQEEKHCADLNAYFWRSLKLSLDFFHTVWHLHDNILHVKQQALNISDSWMSC